MKICFFACTALLCLTSDLRGGVVFSFSGNTDPTAQTWTTSGAGPGTTSGSLTNDNGSGFDSWFVADNSTAVGSHFGYQQTPNTMQIASATANGWTLRTRLRVANDGDSVGNHGSVSVDYIDGTTQFLMSFGSENDGDPIVSLADSNTDAFSGISYTLQDVGSTYNLYELVYDPNSNSADLFVNGIERISDFTGRSGTSTRVSFGALSSFDTGQGNYNLVQWQIAAVPEPSAFVLFVSGSLLPLLRRRWSIRKA